MSACTKCDNQNAADALFCARCGTQVEAIETLAVGTMVGGGRYRVDALLGVGGMGSVYKATDIGLQRTVALKLLNPELTAHPTARRRMLQEARILARIHHPNVVQVRSVFEEASVLAMELEFMPGGDLLGAIPVGGMPEEEAIRVMRDVLAGLQALHEAGLVHRDVKPDNVLLTADGAAKVTDLGVARDSSAREKTKLGAVLGTPEYMSPEQIQGQPVDRRADLYSAGIMLFRMLSGGLPYQASSEFEWQEAHVRMAPDLGTLRKKGSDALVGVVKKALAKKPEERWQTAEDMKEALAPLPTDGDKSMAQVVAAQAALERLEADRASRSEPAVRGDEASQQARVRAESDRVAIAQVEAEIEAIRAKGRRTPHNLWLLVGLAILALSIAGLAVFTADKKIDIRTPNNVVDSQTQEGLAYEYGTGYITQDKAKAAKLYRKACYGGSAHGCYHLGWSYYNGAGVIQDKLRAGELFKMACDAGHAKACKHGRNY